MGLMINVSFHTKREGMWIRLAGSLPNQKARQRRAFGFRSEEERRDISTEAPRWRRVEKWGREKERDGGISNFRLRKWARPEVLDFRCAFPVLENWGLWENGWAQNRLRPLLLNPIKRRIVLDTNHYCQKHSINFGVLGNITNVGRDWWWLIWHLVRLWLKCRKIWLILTKIRKFLINFAEFC